MPETLRSVTALTGLGAGLIHLAMGAGSPLPVAIVLVTLGLAELVWAISVLARGRAIAPNAALVVALLPIALWGLVTVVRVVGGVPGAITALPLGPLAAASLLNLAVALSLTARRRAERSRSARPSRARHPRPGRFLIGMLLGAAAVAGIVTPALAATNAGSFAVPHGEHGHGPAQQSVPNRHSGH
ncbi:hypothetical protein L1277_001388 [Okibacterium sp. HSC-33S16]|uniref:hypothetical protein n=1 Tax=Okibacterium sp. HSC-33S16 TaxID=2910965 RepID=UPI00209E2163|nr:hypothetical protein [Okibacterium sp. HSC-33S16]MCP2031297.1 hypothetical protein [Okibacterium sp. HSC-33S16]